MQKQHSQPEYVLVKEKKVCIDKDLGKYTTRCKNDFLWMIEL